MRAKFSSTQSGHVTLEYDDEITGERKDIEFFAPRPEGYVRIADKQGHFPQVCYGLYSTGDTLWSKPENLLALIKHEWKRKQRMEKAENAY